MSLERLEYQIERVLQGEASLLESAHTHHVDVDQIEANIDLLLKKQIILGSGDVLGDLMMASYMIGRKQQFFASMCDLFTKEVFKASYERVCLKMGIHAKRLN